MTHGARALLRRHSYPVVFALPALAFVTLFVALPAIEGVRLSFYRWDLLGPQTFVGLNNFTRLLGNPDFAVAARNTMVFAIVGPIAQTGLALVIAALIMEVGRVGVLYRSLFFLPAVVALVGIALMWSFIYNPVFGFLNEILRAVGLGDVARAWLGDPSTALPAVLATSVWRWLGFTVVIYLAGLQAISRDFYEAASIDGASPIRSFFSITVPLIAPFTLVNLIVNALGYLRTFDLVWVMTEGGPGNATQTMSTWIYQQAFRFFNLGPAAAATVAQVLVAIVFTLALFVLTRRLGLAHEADDQ